MTNYTDRLITIINELSELSEEERGRILAEAKRLEKQCKKSEFKLSRTLKDKEIAINVLNTTIEKIEQVNEKLRENKEALRQQKKIIEDKSKTLIENLKKLEQSYREMEQFAYIASHDLKSPLRTISNFAQLLKRRYFNQLDEEANEFINYIISGTKQMHEVICDSLEYAQVDKVKEKFGETDMQDVMLMVSMNLKSEIEKSSASIVYEKMPALIGNRTSLIQLFQNLIGNAIKFRGEQPPRIDIGWKKKGDGVEFRVMDNGIGIEKDYHEKIFLPFQRLNRNDLPGSGIGLAICKKIVHLHGGEIACHSVVGEGTTFIFTIYPQQWGTSFLSPTVAQIDSQRA